MGFLPTGALMKLSASDDVYGAKPGEQICIPITIDRSEKLVEDVQVQLWYEGGNASKFIAAEAMTLGREQVHAEFPITISSIAAAESEIPFKLRATLMQGGKLPVISEINVVIDVRNASFTLLP